MTFDSGRLRPPHAPQQLLYTGQICYAVFRRNCPCYAAQSGRYLASVSPDTPPLPMKIAKPLLLIATPLGIVGGLREAWRFSPGLAFLMVALLAVIGAAFAMVGKTVRDEKRAEAARLAAEGSTRSPSTKREVSR